MKSKGIATVCLLAMPGVLLSGCVGLSLQFGGKTHNCNGSKEIEETTAKIAHLEHRIDALEQYAGVTPSKPLPPLPPLPPIPIVAASHQ